MNDKMKFIIQASVGVVIVILTHVVFFLKNVGVEKSLIDHMALFFLTISQLVFIGEIMLVSLKKHFKGNVFFNVGILTTGFLYMSVTFLLSLFARGIFGIENVNEYIMTNTMIIGAKLILSSAILIGGIGIAKRRGQEVKSARFIDELKMEVDEIKRRIMLIEDAKGMQNTAMLVEKLREEISYSDRMSNSSASSVEKDIEYRIIELKRLSEVASTDIFDEKVFCENINEVIGLIKKRNSIVLEYK